MAIELRRSSVGQRILTLQFEVSDEELAEMEDDSILYALYNNDAEPIVAFVDLPARGATVKDLLTAREEEGPAEFRVEAAPAAPAGAAWWDKGEGAGRDPRFEPVVR